MYHNLAMPSDLATLESALTNLPPPAPKPVLVLVCGLPGSGKSHFSRKLLEKVPLACVHSDVMRKALFTQPDYSERESARLFPALHSLIRRLLQRRLPVLFDATNLTERTRSPLYRIADELGAKLFIVFTTASHPVIKTRLDTREKGSLEATRSDADWAVYLKMLPHVQIPKRDHLLVDTSKDIRPTVENLAQQIREAMSREST
jgi:predicted kinase